MERTVIYPPTLDWDFLPQRPQKLFAEFAKDGWLVYYGQKTQRKGKAIEEVLPGVRLIHDEAAFLSAVVPTLQNQLVWCTWANLVERLPLYRPAKVVFEWLDDFPDYRPALPAMFKAADCVFASATSLAAKAGAIHPHVRHIPNACDYETESAGGLVPPDIAELRRPIIGFVGAWGWWCSNEVLLHLAEAFPNASLVIVGPEYGHSVPSAPNIHVLGSKPYSEIAAYMAAFDVALIPFDQSETALAADPIKLWQYLAAGVPVVATDTPETRRHSAHVQLAISPGEFVEEVRKALTGATPSTRAGRRTYARANTWRHRYRSIMKALRQYGVIE